MVANQDVPADDTDGDDPSEGLIRKAKRRARRRRLLYGGAAVVVAIAIAIAAVVVLATFRSDAPPPQHATPPVTPRPAVPLGAPIVVGPDAASTLIASYGEIHVGYVFIYADGRVVSYPDGLVFVDADRRVTRMQGARPLRDLEFGYAVIERQLSAHGLELVRDGKVDPREFLVSPSSREDAWHPPGELPVSADLREELWAEPTARLYEPSAYAICETEVASVASVPPVVQPLLDGQLRRYDPSVAFANPEMDLFSRSSDGAPLPPMDCYELTAAETAVLYRILDGNGWIPHPPDQPKSPFALDWFGWAGGVIYATPIYPHGQPVVFGG